MSDDGELARQRERLLEQLFRHYAPTVFRYAMKSVAGDRLLAEDIVQKVFARVWEHPEVGPLAEDMSHEEITGWLLTSARYNVLDLWRTKQQVQRERTVLCSTENLEILARHSMMRARWGTADRDPAAVVLDTDSIRWLWKLLRGRLTNAEYQVAVMSWEFGFADWEISISLGIKVESVQAYRSRARRKIRVVLGTGQPDAEGETA